jgi:MinD-like ATPase involved in chromosome partitioning or flagellar assembly
MTKIISIHSFRGGTGKSNLIANFAVTLAMQGKRVGIVDTDIQSPGIHVLFGLDKEQVRFSLNDYLWNRCNIKDTAYDVGHAFPEINSANGKLYLIPSSIKTGEITRVLREGYDVGRLNYGFQELISSLQLDYLTIDTHPGLNEETLLSIAVSDMLVVILRPDRQDFQGTAVTVDVARKLEVPEMLLVVNKALPGYDFPALQQQVEATYHTPVAGILPLTEEMVELASSGIFCLRHTNHPFTQIVQEIAKQMVGEVQSQVLVASDRLQ